MLHIKNLCINFYQAATKQWLEVVHQLNFELEQGKTLGIVGESGSGKSVTSFAIMQLLPQNTSRITGEILFEGTNLLKLNAATIRKYRGQQIAMIFQEPMTSLNPLIACGQQVSEAIRLHQGVDKEKAKQITLSLFEEVQLPRPEQLFKTFPHELSGGQKQRVMIAMALSCNPKLLIADEPTTALDTTVQKTIVNLLKKITAERNMSMIFISHDLGLVSEIADEVLVMYKGNVVEQGSIKQVFEHPTHAYTKGLIACKPSPKLLLKHLPTVDDFLKGTATEKLNAIISPQEIAKRQSQIYAQPALLKVSNLLTKFEKNKGLFGKSKEEVIAVNNVSLQVFEGECLGLVGESGCGKSTLGRSLLQLIRPSSGSVEFDGTDLCTLSETALRPLRKNMQLIFQDPYSSLNPRLTVGQAIAEALQVHQILQNKKEQKDYIINLLEKVNLNPEHYDRYPHEFSGGQRQRIVIARAISLKPKLIICDESVSALDVSVQAQVLNLLRDLQSEFKLTYIFISHDLTVVKHLTDRIIVMNKGKIVEEGYPNQLFEAPQEEYTKKLIAAIPGYAS